jgi:excisionase family DNA binding protein
MGKHFQAFVVLCREPKAMEGSTKLINIAEAAEYLGVSAASLRAWSDRGLLRVYRTPGGQRRFSIEDLENFKRSMRQPPRG